MLASFWLPDALTLRLMLPEFILVAAAVAVLLAAVLLGRDTRIATSITVVGGLAAAWAAWWTLPLVAGGSIELFAIPAGAGFGGATPGMMVADALGQFVRIIVALLLVVTVAIAHWFDRHWQERSAEFLMLLICSAVGMMFMASATNLLLLIIAIELTSMPSYALAGFDRSRRTSAEAATKYVIFGAATTGIAVFGASILFGLFGSLHIPSIATVMHASVGGASNASALTVLCGLVLLLAFANVLFKVSAVPLHFWCPDVFEGAPLSVTTWLSTASKAAAIVLLVRVVWILGQGGPTAAVLHGAIATTVALLAVLSMVLANVAAFRQTNVRRLLAYSSIAHAGTMLAAAAIVPTAQWNEPAALSAIVQYIAVYALMNVGAFVCLGLVARDSDSERIDAFTGVGWRDPLVATSLTVCLFALVGLPPLGGFLVKFWVIAALSSAATSGHSAESALLWALVITIVLNTAISLYYYVSIVRAMFLFRSAEPGIPLVAPTSAKLLVHICAIGLILIGTLLAGPLKRGGDAVAASLAPPSRVAASW